MSKLTLEALRSRAEATASNDLLATISGGTENDCHPKDFEDLINDQQGSPKPPLSPLGEAAVRWWNENVLN